MLLYASLITDIAHYYPEWIITRLREGFFDIERKRSVDRFNLKDNNLEKIIFWSRDPLPLVKRIDELLSFGYDFEIVYMISLYDKFYEPHIKEKHKIFTDIRKLSEIIGKNKVSLCYGPIFETYNTDIDWHIHQFDFLCKSLSSSIGKTYTCFNISDRCLHDPHLNISALSDYDKISVINKMNEISKKYGLILNEKPLIKNLKSDEIDVGIIDACPAGCLYCDGLSNPKSAKIKARSHISSSNTLIGKIEYSSRIREVILKKEHSKSENSPQLSF